MDISNPLPRRMGTASPRQGYQALVAARIERAMADESLTKLDLCRELGWPNRNRLDRYLTGERSLDLYTLSEIARALNVEPADLVPPAVPRKSA